MRKLTCSAYVTGWLRDVVLTSAFVVVTAAAHQAFAQIDTVTVQGRQHREIIELQGASVHGFQDTGDSCKTRGLREINRRPSTNWKWTLVLA